MGSYIQQMALALDFIGSFSGDWWGGGRGRKKLSFNIRSLMSSCHSNWNLIIGQFVCRYVFFGIKQSNKEFGSLCSSYGRSWMWTCQSSWPTTFRSSKELSLICSLGSHCRRLTTLSSLMLSRKCVKRKICRPLTFSMRRLYRCWRWWSYVTGEWWCYCLVSECSLQCDRANVDGVVSSWPLLSNWFRVILIQAMFVGKDWIHYV